MTLPEELIERHIELDPARPGPAEARLAVSGVPVWAIVGHWQAIGRNTEQVAEDYDLSREQVEAALAYYSAHRCAIDARLAANLAHFR